MKKEMISLLTFVFISDFGGLSFSFTSMLYNAFGLHLLDDVVVHHLERLLLIWISDHLH